MDPASPLFMIMAFVLVSIVITGGFALLLPLAKTLAKYLEFRMHERPGVSAGTDELREVRRVIEELRAEVRQVSDRQVFVEKLLESQNNETPRLPR
jgi:hypothetical protein